jgi:hypothetical protein
MGNTVFNIPRRATIESNNKQHKVHTLSDNVRYKKLISAQVTIASLTFNPRMLYYVGPSVSPQAYVHAYTHNTSEYLFLPASNVGVFMDGSFITHTVMPQANPGEVGPVRCFVFVYIHAYTHTYIHTCIHIHIYIHAYTYIHIYMHTHTYIYTYIHIHTYTHTYIYVHIYTHTHIHTYMHTYIHVS